MSGGTARVMYFNGAVRCVNIVISTEVHGVSRVKHYDEHMRSVICILSRKRGRGCRRVGDKASGREFEKKYK